MPSTRPSTRIQRRAQSTALTTTSSRRRATRANPAENNATVDERPSSSNLADARSALDHG